MWLNPVPLPLFFSCQAVRRFILENLAVGRRGGAERALVTKCAERARAERALVTKCAEARAELALVTKCAERARAELALN